MNFEQLGHGENTSPTTPIKVLVCDNESLFREILVAALNKQDSIDVVATAANGLEAIEMATESQPDIVLMDVEQSDGASGIAIAGFIKEAFPNTGIVVLTAQRDKNHLVELLESGATGWSFLVKQSVSDIESLTRAIESAAAGQIIGDPSMLDELLPRHHSPLERLTGKQLDALMLIASGQADSAIATKLEIEEPLVEPLLQTVYTDLHIYKDDAIDQRVQATLLYLQETSQVTR